jgi:putative membrane protein insertion efficiency factor
MKKALMSVIRFYQRRISPLFGPKCRYYPTCSQYALEALEEWGAFKGMLLTIRRLMRCNIFFPGGVDPVPKKKEKK